MRTDVIHRYEKLSASPRRSRCPAGAIAPIPAVIEGRDETARGPRGSVQNGVEMWIELCRDRFVEYTIAAGRRSRSSPRLRAQRCRGTLQGAHDGTRSERRRPPPSQRSRARILRSTVSHGCPRSGPPSTGRDRHGAARVNRSPRVPDRIEVVENRAMLNRDVRFAKVRIHGKYPKTGPVSTPASTLRSVVPTLS